MPRRPKNRLPGLFVSGSTDAKKPLILQEESGIIYDVPNDRNVVLNKPVCRNGRRGGLKIPCANNTCGFDPHHRHQEKAPRNASFWVLLFCYNTLFNTHFPCLLPLFKGFLCFKLLLLCPLPPAVKLALDPLDRLFFHAAAAFPCAVAGALPRSG